MLAKRASPPTATKSRLSPPLRIERIYQPDPERHLQALTLLLGRPLNPPLSPGMPEQRGAA